MAGLEDSYTRYPRPILWLVRGADVDAGDESVASFYLSKLPVSNAQFSAFDAAFVPDPASPSDDDPAVGVDWESASAYCAWYARVSHKPMRLPTESEWEYACRAGTNTRWFFGDDPKRAGDYIVHAGSAGGRLMPLRRTRPNPNGLHAMLGGVWEWTASRDRPGSDERVLRGGSFRTPLEEIGCALRRTADPRLRADDVGFRIARSLEMR